MRFDVFGNSRSWIFACSSVLLVSCGGGGGSAASPAALDIRYTSALPATEIPSSCLGTTCDVTGSTTYRGDNSLVLAYRNSTAEPVLLDIDFLNVTRGQEITYVYSSGMATGASGFAGATTDARARLATETLKTTGANSPASSFRISPGSYSIKSQASISAGSKQSWYQSKDDKSVNAAVQSTCMAGTGRRVVLWSDSSTAVLPGIASQMDAFGRTLCGPQGGVARLTRLLGDVWGLERKLGASADGLFIKDEPGALLDINVVVVSGGKDAGWAGFFDPTNTFTRMVEPGSNEALALFINSDAISDDLAFVRSTLLHELTHMIGWYQRTVRLGLPEHDTWLEEMLAMMSEDIVVPSLVTDDSGAPYNKIVTYRLKSYLGTGGGVSLVNWPSSLDLAGGHYGMAGSFGAYLNRRYGLDLYLGLMTCPATGSSWECLESVIKAQGGNSANEEFFQFGSTVFSLGAGANSAAKFSFPAKTVMSSTGTSQVGDTYLLSAVNLNDYRAYRNLPSAQATPGTVTSHAFSTSKVSADIFGLKRNGISVPAKSYLTLSVR